MTPVKYERYVETFAILHSRALHAWQGVEQNLFFIFQDLVGHESAPNLVAAVFHSVNGLGIRIDMTTAAARMRLIDDEDLLIRWPPLAKRIRKQAVHRNCLAHFTIYQGRPKNEPPYLALRPTMFDPLADHQKDEYGVNEIAEWTKNFLKLASDLDDYLREIDARLAPT